MKTRAIVALIALLIPGTLMAQAHFTVNADEMPNGFMNVFELPANGGGFLWGSGWGLPDLTAVFDGTAYANVTLGPNTIGDPSDYWYQCPVGDACGGPGVLGNKLMEANLYGQVDEALAGQTVTFSGEVISHTLTDAHTVVAFVKDFAPDYSSYNEAVVPLTGTGMFSVSLATDAGAGRHVQWGFQMVGENVWVTDVAPFGTVVIGPDAAVPSEPSTWSDLKASFR